MTETLSEPLSFDRVATEYERTRPLPPKVALSVVKFISGVGGDGWILDAGCGTGRFTRPLAARHERTVGVDVSEEMLGEMRRILSETGAPQPNLVPADLRGLPFPDAHFTAVLAVHVLHLIAEWRDAIREMERVTVPGGILMLGYEHRSTSAVRDFYMAEGRRRDLLPAHPGARNTETDMPFIKACFGATAHETITRPEWQWTHRASVGTMLTDLDARLYSSQWQIPASAHEAIMIATRENALNRFGPAYEGAHESLETRFVLHLVRKKS